MNLAVMQKEVAEVNRQKGWYDEPRTFDELISLLHSEVSETLEAYRKRGLESWCEVTFPHAETFEIDTSDDWPEEWLRYAKPEGVGSELADVLIRLLDLAERYEWDLGHEVEKFGNITHRITSSFGDQIAILHLYVSYALIARFHVVGKFDPRPQALAKVYTYLVALAAHHGIDIHAEYARKLNYNRTRSYRHGDKRL